MTSDEMGSLPAEVYIMAKTSQVDSFKHRWEIDMAINMATFFLLGKYFGCQVSWATLNSRLRNLASGELQLEALFGIVFPSY